tara:strand:+ start:206 stop:388 length:183 start_codon:yes stop_codon:yes gene_type:complete
MLMRSKDTIEKELFNACKTDDTLLQSVVGHYINILNDDQVDNLENILTEHFYTSMRNYDL